MMVVGGEKEEQAEEGQGAEDGESSRDLPGPSSLILSLSLVKVLVSCSSSPSGVFGSVGFFQPHVEKKAGIQSAATWVRERDAFDFSPNETIFGYDPSPFLAHSFCRSK